MKKQERMGNYLRELTEGLPERWPSAYTGFFLCFNRQEYYEAHDVLEHLWLRETSPVAMFYKGLIQLSGAFVHLQKHYYRPHHYKFSGRLRPAGRLLMLARNNLRPFAPVELDLKVEEVMDLIDLQLAGIGEGSRQRNPWRPESAPLLWPGERTDQ